MTSKPFTPAVVRHPGEEAAQYYTSIFRNSRIGRVGRYSESAGPPSSVDAVEFEINGQPFVALNGGPQFT
jgi:predicted 3-demethylubiquinone-9 3-methyltransferase (glyoxalase superfamily)